MKDLREIAAYLKGAHQYESAGIVSDAAKWRTAAENFFGQRGTESISAMIDIIDAARKWGRWRRNGSVYSEELDARKKLQIAVDAYEDMVASREETGS